jgi:3-oxoacyl-[acyl-carrier protein] reductase
MILDGKVIVVTGGANGLGRAYCHACWQEGATVIVADHDYETAEALAKALNDAANDQRVTSVGVDVTFESQTVAMAATVIDRHGRVDVLVNNAGTYPHQAFEGITIDAWRHVMAVNAEGTFLATRAVIPSMKERGSGKVVNIATNLVWSGLSEMVHYVAAKSAVVGMTRSLAREYGPHGITVNAIAPGAVFPPAETLDEENARLVNEIINYQCLRRALAVEDLVGPLLFLVSGDSDFITGQVLTVDGGLTMH